MPVFELQESNYAGPIPDDTILVADITGIREVIRPYTDETTGEKVHKIEFSFLVTDATSEFDTQRLWGETSTIFVDHPDCKLYAWTLEVLGLTELPKKFVLDTDNLVGMPCRVVVGSRTYEKNGEERIRNFVKDVIRAKGRSVLPDDEEPF